MKLWRWNVKRAAVYQDRIEVEWLESGKVDNLPEGKVLVSRYPFTDWVVPLKQLGSVDRLGKCYHVVGGRTMVL